MHACVVRLPVHRLWRHLAIRRILGPLHHHCHSACHLHRHRRLQVLSPPRRGEIDRRGDQCGRARSTGFRRAGAGRAHGRCRRHAEAIAQIRRRLPLRIAVVHHHRPARIGQDDGAAQLGTQVSADARRRQGCGRRGRAERAIATGGSPRKRSSSIPRDATRHRIPTRKAIAKAGWRFSISSRPIAPASPSTACWWLSASKT